MVYLGKNEGSGTNKKQDSDQAGENMKLKCKMASNHNALSAAVRNRVFLLEGLEKHHSRILEREVS